MLAQMRLHAIVVDQRVVDVEQKDNVGLFTHRSGRPLTLLLLAEELLDYLGDALRLEAVFPQELLERGRRAECLHADDAARLAYITLPAESGGLLHRDARGNLGRQHARPVRLALILEN